MPDVAKRGWLLVSGIPPQALPPEPFEVVPGIWAGRSSDDEGRVIPEHLEKWNNSLSAGSALRQPDLAIWMDRSTDSRAIDLVNQELTTRLGAVFSTLSYVLQRGRLGGVILVEIRAEPGVQSRASLYPVRCRGPRRSRAVLDLANWPAVLTRRLRPFPLNEPAMFWAVNAFERACREPYEEDRLELFCRSVETLLQTREGAPEFAAGILAHQGREPTAGRQKRYRSIYEIRNGIVHGYRFLRPRQSPSMSARLMEEVARRMLVDVMTSDEHFDRIREHHRGVLADRTERRKRRPLQELDWTHLPRGLRAQSLWDALHDGVVTAMRTDQLARTAEIEIDVDHLREYANFPLGTRFVLRFEGVASVRATQFTFWPGGHDSLEGKPREEQDRIVQEYWRRGRTDSFTVSDAQSAVVGGDISDAEVIVAQGQAAVRLQCTSPPGATVGLVVRAERVRATRSDGVAFSLEDLRRLGKSYWTAFGEQ